MSYKVDVVVRGEKDWVSNALRFATTEEAEIYGRDLFRRWLLVDEWRVTESPDPVNYLVNNGELAEL